MGILNRVGKCVLVGVLTMGLGFAAQSEESVSIEAAALEAPLMSYTELFNLFSRKSWKWDSGVGYFGFKGRRFVSALPKIKSYGEGKWLIPRPGKLCFSAAWTGPDGTNEELTCFLHRSADGIIYQRRLPDGEWYVFKNSRVGRYDEYRKLELGDYASHLVKKIKAGRGK